MDDRSDGAAARLETTDETTRGFAADATDGITVSPAAETGGSTATNERKYPSSSRGRSNYGRCSGQK
ncbi:hypothetical protein [Halosolutus halophilus]|uniref:hypothetical protein n=1 Tax=Halosolutus halophilus TaxID=1552990 RepID=UPI002234EE3C|nr:hypothetical protein [Halosolutus halophilus]